MKRSTQLSILAIVALFGALVVSPALRAERTAIETTADRKLAADLADAVLTDGELRVIVTHAPGFDDRERFSASGARVLRKLSAGGALAATMTPREIRMLAEDPRVLRISPDRVVRATMDSGVPTVGADRVAEHLGLTGNDVTVALIDSGISPSSSVASSRILASVDFTGLGNSDRDEYGHGTHIASIIGGSGERGSVRGVAPGVNFVSLRVLDGEGQGHVSDVIAAIDWTIKNRDAFGIRIVNLSLGHAPAEPYAKDPLTRAVARAWSAGLTVVVSAGNRGRTAPDHHFTIDSPGNSPYVLTVGAMNDQNSAERADDVMTTFSSRGPSFGDFVLKPDVVAPGNRVVSQLAPGARMAESFSDGLVGRDRLELSGTSMAAGFVSGMAAILIERSPSLTNDLLKRIVMVSAEDVPGEDPFAAGAGYVDVVRALALTGPFAPVRFDSSSPIVVRTERGFELARAESLTAAELGRLDGNAAIWGDLTASAAIWGDFALWGNAAIWGDHTVTDNAAIWGDLSLSGNAAIWGDFNLTGNAAIWGDYSLWGAAAIWGDLNGNAALWGDLAGSAALWGDLVLRYGD